MAINFALMRINKSLLIFSTLAASALSANAALSISLNFDNDDALANFSNLNNNDWDGSTSDSVKRDTFEAAVSTAAARWEYAFRSSPETLTLNIAVSWDAIIGSPLAQGGSSFVGSNITSSSLTFDTGASTFFVDTTPSESSEWAAFTERSLDFGGGSINVERVSHNSSISEIRSNHDLYSVALHEIGHTLGVLSTYPGYTALQSGGNLSLTDGNDIPFSGGHTNISISSPDNYPFERASVGATYNPNSLSSGIVIGARKDLTAVDIQLVADIHGLSNFDTSQVPEPSSTALLGLGSLGLLIRRKRTT